MGSSEDYLGTADRIAMHKQGIQLWVNRVDNSIGKLSTVGSADQAVQRLF